MVTGPAFLVLLLLLISTSLLGYRSTAHLCLPAQMASVRQVGELIDEFARHARFSDDAIFQCRLALDEACSNIIRHAYADDPSGEIEVRVEAVRGTLTVHLIDFGEPYNPDIVHQPEFDQPIDQMRPGGLGIHLMRTVLDTIR